MESLSQREQRIASVLAAAAIPGGAKVTPGGPATVKRLEKWLHGGSDLEVRGIKGLLWAAEMAAVPATGRRLSSLSPDRARRLLETWQGSDSQARRLFLRAVLTPLKAAHFDDAKMFEVVGCGTYGGDPDARARVDESARWMQQVTDGRTAFDELDVECEVVVVGTGAGGAACAYELASRGRAVLLLEEGDYHRRSSFTSHAREMSKRLFRDQGLTFALGNISAPVWAGRAVGGSTVVNSGTCYRAPERIFASWRDELGLTDFSAASMAPYYERVEAMLQVAPAKRELTGGVGRVIARGADALGYHHHPIPRNAPDCDGQGVCCFGCPTGAKRSTDVSYVPEALKKGAQLVTAAKVEGIDVAHGRASGVRGTLGSGRVFRVKADAVVIAGGALMTPVLLRNAGVCKGSDMLGKNLSIHPASKVMAVFDETIDMTRGIPQGYAVDEFIEQGIMFEGASTPLDVTAIAIPWVGARFTELMEGFQNLALFGFMIADTSRGQVRPGPGGSPLITYNMNEADAQKMGRATALLCEIFQAAGARRIAPMIPGVEEVSSPADIDRLRTRRFRPGDFEVTAYHPLGTCRIGTDPTTSVLSPEHEAHELERLFVVDGSAVPTALGVNPQMTIMAMALRAAAAIDHRLG
jgi:glycine/D-amino acid oxidase-like deaminating enzyme